MVPAVVKLHGLDPLGLFNYFAERLSLLVGDVLHHDLGRAEGHKFPFHQLKALTGLGILRQIVGQTVVDLYPVS